jgi:hypothetical protein
MTLSEYRTFFPLGSNVRFGSDWQNNLAGSSGTLRGNASPADNAAWAQFGPTTFPVAELEILADALNPAMTGPPAGVQNQVYQQISLNTRFGQIVKGSGFLLLALVLVFAGVIYLAFASGAVDKAKSAATTAADVVV